MKYKIGDHVIIEESNIERLSKFAGRTGVIGKVQKGLENDHPYWINVDNWGDDTDGVWCNVKGLVEEVKENKVMKCKFKVGDKVIGNSKNEYNITKKGWVGHVVELGSNGMIRVTNNDIGEFGFFVNPDFFDLFVDTTHKIVITHDGKTTTATMYHDGEKTVATARCAPEDEFDFNVGAKLAMERLMNIVAPVTVKGFKVGDRVHVGKCNGTVICIATDDDFGVEFDSEDSPGIHGCGAVELKAGKPSSSKRCKWYSPYDDEVEHGEYVPKYYNGKMVCIEKGHNDYTVGKIYEVVDGKFTNDKGSTINPYGTPFKTFDEIVKFSSAKWIEIKE